MAENLNIPDSLPTLAAGAHKKGDGKACVMEYVSMLAGEEFTDLPQCTHRVLAKTAQYVNDGLAGHNRHLLVPLIGRLFGTSETKTANGESVSVILAHWSAAHAKKTNAYAYAAAAYADADAYAAAAAAAADDAYAYAYAAAADADADAYAAAYAGRDAGDRAKVQFLSELIDEYDRITGRVETRDVSSDDLMNLACDLKERANV